MDDSKNYHGHTVKKIICPRQGIRKSERKWMENERCNNEDGEQDKS